MIIASLCATFDDIAPYEIIMSHPLVQWSRSYSSKNNKRFSYVIFFSAKFNACHQQVMWSWLHQKKYFFLKVMSVMRLQQNYFHVMSVMRYQQIFFSKWIVWSDFNKIFQLSVHWSRLTSGKINWLSIFICWSHLWLDINHHS